MDEKLRQTVKFMRSNGILKLRNGDLELELSPQAIAMRPKRSGEPETEAPPKPEYTDMDILLWSAPGLMLPEDEDA